MANYIVRTLTEDGVIDSPDIDYDTLDGAIEGYYAKGMWTFDTESLFYPGDPYWTLQLIHTESDAVLMETNSILESIGLFDG